MQNKTNTSFKFRCSPKILPSQSPGPQDATHPKNPHIMSHTTPWHGIVTIVYLHDPTWGFLKIGVPPNHPWINKVFHENSPSILGAHPPIFWETPPYKWVVFSSPIRLMNSPLLGFPRHQAVSPGSLHHFERTGWCCNQVGFQPGGSTRGLKKEFNRVQLGSDPNFFCVLCQSHVILGSLGVFFFQWTI